MRFQYNGPHGRNLVCHQFSVFVSLKFGSLPRFEVFFVAGSDAVKIEVIRRTTSSDL